MNFSLKHRNLADIIISLLLSCGSLAFLMNMHKFVYGGMKSTVGPLVFPRFVIIVAVILSFLLLLFALFKPAAKKQISPPAGQSCGPETAEALDSSSTKKSIIYVAVLFAYLIMLQFIGFLISTPIVLLVVAYILNGRNFKVLAPMSIIFSTTLYFVAARLMHIILPAGIWFE